MDFKERFSKLAYALGLSVAQLQKKLGVSNAYVQNTKSPSAKVLAVLREQYPQVNADWLENGIGEMGKRIGIDNLTLYWARHTWATFAYNLDIPDDTISRALGHSQTSGANVTGVYIRASNKKVDEANRAVIDYLLNEIK